MTDEDLIERLKAATFTADDRRALMVTAKRSESGELLVSLRLWTPGAGVAVLDLCVGDARHLAASILIAAEEIDKGGRS